MAMLQPRVNSIALTLVIAAALPGRTPAPALTPSVADSNEAIEGLRQVSKQLTASVKVFNTHLGEAIARHDRAHRAGNGQPPPSADFDLASGPLDTMFSAVRKLAAFRILASRSETYNPVALADMDRIQQLIVEARSKVDASTAILRRLLVVPVQELDRRSEAPLRASHDRLLKARAAAEDAATRALLVLPVAEPETDAKDENAQTIWDLLTRALPSHKANTLPAPEPAIPIRLEHRHRVTLVNDNGFRIAITDSGIEDTRGRHLFYQEEWAQRGSSVIRFRWQVAVDTATGDHILLRRYPPLELEGSLDELYNLPVHDSEEYF